MLAAKSVTFNPSDQTPLMFSRASSYDSLNSFDQVRYPETIYNLQIAYFKLYVTFFCHFPTYQITK